MSMRTERPFLRSGYAAALMAVAALGLAAGLLALPRIERAYLVATAERGDATLKLAAEGVRGALRRYEPLPALIGERPILAQLLTDRNNAALEALVNEELRRTAEAIDATDVYLIDMSGITIAASSYLTQRSFVGRSFSYRPYFTEAREGRLGRYFALGTTADERGYFYAAPVWDGEQILGVVAVKFTVAAFEEAWRAGDSEMVVTDLNGIVFMSSRPDWGFRALAPLTPQVLDKIAATRDAPVGAIGFLPPPLTALGGGYATIRIDEADGPADYVTSSVTLEDVGWRAIVLVPAAPARTKALATLALAVMGLMLVGLIATIILQRRAQMIERLAAQRATQDLLERRVAERTDDLNRANQRLTREVEERRATEQQLRKTQTDLIQAGKLAALGQMSAALSHEINQPLAAVKSYADNAITYLDRGRLPEVRKNVGHISDMADRMAAISGHLRNFARRPQEQVGPIPVLPVLDDAAAVIGTRVRARGAVLHVDAPAADLWVVGGRLRLQQVLVNLLANALDAMEGQDSPVVEVTVRDAGARVEIEVRDRGAGLDEQTLAQIFDPFFTTKSPGKGLGLGLSISYNIVEDFGGRLSARNHPETGAVFTVSLVRAEAPGLGGAPDGVAAQ